MTASRRGGRNLRSRRNVLLREDGNLTSSHHRNLLSEVGVDSVAVLDIHLQSPKVLPEHSDGALMFVDGAVQLRLILVDRLGVLVDDPEVLVVKVELRLGVWVLDVSLKFARILRIVPLLKVAKCDVKVPTVRSRLLQQVNARNLSDSPLMELVRNKLLDEFLAVHARRATGEGAGVDAGDVDGKLVVEDVYGVDFGGRGSRHFVA